MKNIIIALIFVTLLLTITQLTATTINIPGDQPTIQAGINVSVDSDTVLVQPGTYTENINFDGKNIVVASLFLITQEDSYINQTIIDGNQNGSVVTFENGETSAAMICGFTITNGSGNMMPNNVPCGGGIFCHKDSDPTIMNCIVTQNNAGDGGGVFAYLHSDPIIIDVEISYNSTNDDGGGLHCNWGSNLTLENVKIINNSCSDKGGGICCGHNEHSTDLDLDYVLISNNYSGEKGSAIYMVNSISYFDHVSICDNTTASNYWGSIYCDSSSINTNNCIIWNNQNFGFHFVNNGFANVTYSDTQDYFVGAGNIMLNPQFIDPLIGNYHLQENSPCIDAGDPSSPLDPDGTITDMGAMYFDQSGLLNADFEGTPSYGSSPLEVQFTDLSTGNITFYMWDFNNDGFVDSNEQNPSFAFQQIGTYDVSLTVTDGVSEDTELKMQYITVTDTTNANNLFSIAQTELLQNYPNPFNPTTTISFLLNQEANDKIELAIYNLKGQLVKTFSNIPIENTVDHQIVWNGTNELGEPVCSGLYFYILKTNAQTYTRKMMLLK